jgi:ATP-dependent exoDNAse (exonuclease V) beta subunit
LTQLSSDDSLAVNLMTIHKSKGLEYETVLFYYNSTSKKPNDTSKFKMYVDYDKKYEHVVNFFITLRKYAGILEYTDYAAVDEQNAIKQEHEEMNALYVGLTRAKKNMAVFLDVKSYKGGEVKDILALKLRGLYSSVFDYKSGEIAENVKDDNKIKVEDYNIDILDYIDNTKFSKLDTNSFNKKLKLADEFKRKVGLAIHYYFEHIKNNIEIEKMQAESALFLKYGNLLGIERVENILARVQKFIDNNKEIYNSKYKVYTEFEITNENAEKRIIDRVNIDEDAKEITIYDYKTGEDPGNKEKYIKQLEEYKKIIEEKTNGEYKIMTKILEI